MLACHNLYSWKPLHHDTDFTSVLDFDGFDVVDELRQITGCQLYLDFARRRIFIGSDDEEKIVTLVDKLDVIERQIVRRCINDFTMSITLTFLASKIPKSSGSEYHRYRWSN